MPMTGEDLDQVLQRTAQPTAATDGEAFSYGAGNLDAAAAVAFVSGLRRVQHGEVALTDTTRIERVTLEFAQWPGFPSYSSVPAQKYEARGRLTDAPEGVVPADVWVRRLGSMGALGDPGLISLARRCNDPFLCPPGWLPDAEVEAVGDTIVFLTHVFDVEIGGGLRKWWPVPPESLLAAYTLVRTVAALDVPRAAGGSGLQIGANPARGALRVSFDLARRERGRLCVYDIAGRTVHESARTEWAPGRHEYHWDGAGRMGSRLSAGVCFVALSLGERRDVKRFVWLP